MHPPDVIHMVGVPIFHRSSASVHYTEHKPNNKNRIGLGTKLGLMDMQSKL